MHVFFRFGIFNPTVVYDHLGEIYSALIFGSFVFCIFLYIKVRQWNSRKWSYLFPMQFTLKFLTQVLCLLGSFGTIFYWFWLIWEHNNWLLLGKLISAFLLWLRSLTKDCLLRYLFIWIENWQELKKEKVNEGEKFDW